MDLMKYYGNYKVLVELEKQALMSKMTLDAHKNCSDAMKKSPQYVEYLNDIKLQFNLDLHRYKNAKKKFETLRLEYQAPDLSIIDYETVEPE